MVKACDSSGSRGITKVSFKEELEKAYLCAMNETHTDHIVVEKFIQGIEIGVDAFVEDNEMKFCLPHNKFVYRTGEVTIPIGHSFPYFGNDLIINKIKKEMEKAIRATKLNNCAVNGDFIITNDNEVSVIEIGGRCGATCIPELIERYTGIDYYKQMILVALGEKADFSIHKKQPCMAQLLYSDVNGVIDSINYDKINLLRNGSNEIVLDYKAGDSVHKMENGTHRIGHVIAETEDITQFEELICKVKECIKIRKEDYSCEKDWNKYK